MSFVQKLDDFIGNWKIDRAIDDRLSGQEGRFEGHARFVREGDILRYREEGLLSLGGGPPMTAVREYLWRDAAGRIVVDHGDGRVFHDFDPAEPVARHLCGPDEYRVTYDFHGWPDWSAEWKVIGPRKDYTMISRYSR